MVLVQQPMDIFPKLRRQWILRLPQMALAKRLLPRVGIHTGSKANGHDKHA